MSMQPIQGATQPPSFTPNPAQLQGRGNSVDTVAAGVAPTVAPQSAAAVQAVEQPLNMAQVRDATDKLNRVLQGVNRDLNFSVDEDTGMNVVKVVDIKTKEVIRQFPTQEVLKIAKSIDQLQGMLIRQKA